jgi:hypothetical protein
MNAGDSPHDAGDEAGRQQAARCYVDFPPEQGHCDRQMETIVIIFRFLPAARRVAGPTFK